MTTPAIEKALAQLRWLAERGAKFCLPAGRTKGQFPTGWQNDPKDLAAAEQHALQGGNVGLLTGQHSAGIVAIDVDRNWADQVARLGDFASTGTVHRHNAPDRGKLLYQVDGDLPKSASWKEDPDAKKPDVELLSTGRHALIPPSQFEEGHYILRNGKAGIRQVTPAELTGIWFLLTGTLLGEKHAPRENATTGAGLTRNPFVATVKARWDCLTVFQHFGRVTADQVERRSNGELHAKGNAGLLVKPDRWFCHGDGAGGDNLDAWHWCETGRTLDRGDQAAFWRTVEAMAAAAGIEKPTHGASSTVEQDDDGDDQEDADDGADAEPALPHPLRDVAAVDLAALTPRLGWLHDFAEYAAQLGGAPYEFGLLTSLLALAGAVGGAVKLEYPMTVRPNLYGAIVAPSSVFRKSTTIGAIYDLYRAAEITDAVIGTSITGEALIEQLAERSKVKDEAGNQVGAQPAAGLLVQMELRDVLRSDRVKYSLLLKNTLTELFDGFPLKRRLRSGSHSFDESALSIVGGTVPDTIFEDMTDEDWRSGFAARWLFVTTHQEPDFDTPLPDADPQEVTAARRRRLAALAELPRQLYAIPQTTMTITPAAVAMWDVHRRRTEQAAHQFDNDVLRYTVTRLNTVTLKLAMLVNLATANGDDWTSIDTYTMTTALALTDYFKLALADLLTTRDKKAKHTGALQGVLAKIVKANKEGQFPTVRDVRRMHHDMDASMAQALLDELYRRGAVVPFGNKYPRYRYIHEKLPIAK